MSRNAAITFAWADGEYAFRLAIGQLRSLQEKCDAGPGEILARVISGRWKLDDLRETIRLGLIGGGMEPVPAMKLVREYVDERPLMESVLPARVILMAALVGPADEPVGKAEAPAAATETAGSTSPPSTAPAP